MNEAGKVMGLAAYGDPSRLDGLRYLEFNERSGAVHISFDELARQTRPNVSGRDVTGDSHYEDLAAHIQATTSDFLVRLVRGRGTGWGEAPTRPRPVFLGLKMWCPR
jgi:predicted NodU family carbamoyl transferase